MSDVVDEIEVLDAMTLHQEGRTRADLMRGDDAMNQISVHVPDNFGKDTQLVFFLDGKEIGWLSAVKLAKLALKVKIATHGE